MKKSGKDCKKRKLQMFIVERQWDELKELADYEGRTVSDLVRQILAEFLKDSEYLDRIKGGDK
jgi:hypothetical protein